MTLAAAVVGDFLVDSFFFLRNMPIKPLEDDDFDFFFFFEVVDEVVVAAMMDALVPHGGVGRRHSNKDGTLLVLHFWSQQ